MPLWLSFTTARAFLSQRKHPLMPLPSPEECGQNSLAAGNCRIAYPVQGRGGGIQGNGTTYVTETILSSFQPFTPTFSSHKASHLRTPHTCDLTNDKPASSKNFPSLSLFPPHSPPTHRIPIFPRLYSTMLFLSSTSQGSTSIIRLSQISTPTLCRHLVCRSHPRSTLYHLLLFLT